MSNRSLRLACFLRRAMLGLAAVVALAGSLAWPVQAVPLYRLTQLGTLGGLFSFALGINDRGQIVGSAETAIDQRAFLFENGTMFDLNALIDPNDPLFGQVPPLVAASGISADGAIAATGPGDGPNAFLLTPVPVQPVLEPATLALLAAGLAGLGLLARRRRA